MMDEGGGKGSRGCHGADGRSLAQGPGQAYALSLTERADQEAALGLKAKRFNQEIRDVDRSGYSSVGPLYQTDQAWASAFNAL